MSPTDADTTPSGVDAEPVSHWLTEHIEGAVAPFEFELITGGRSNLTYRVTGADGRRFVLRRPPLGNVLESAHDMGREHKIISAVGRTDVPVPTTRGLCDDDSVNGAPFYVMDFVDGEVLDAPERAEVVPRDRRPALAEHLIDVLADLHSVDVDAVGLGDLARRDGYIERQLKRWNKQWEASKTRELAIIDEVSRLLAENVPEQQGVSIAHGDYRFGNCLTDPETAKIAAVLDWELCTLGDPLADVGYLGVSWTDPGNEPRRPNDPTSAGGFPRYDELLERYSRRTGRDLSDIGYYVGFSSWRLAIIGEGVYARYLAGVMGDEPDRAMLQGFEEGTVQLAEAALDALRPYR